MAKDLEITGPLAVKLRISSDTIDADLFLVLSVYDTQGKEVVFVGSNDPRTPVGLGWLRASHRKLDPEKSTPYRPWHTHDEKQPLIPKQAEELDVEIWPTSIVVPKDYQLALSIRGKDYEFDGTAAPIPNAPFPMKGVGPFTHTNLQDRPPHIFNTLNHIHFSNDFTPYILLPIIPSKND
jgi:predicted acyl esterase